MIFIFNFIFIFINLIDLHKKGDPWSGFLYRIRETPHLTDGFTEFYCLYTHAAYYSQKMNSTIFEVIDFMIDKTYFIHLGLGTHLTIICSHWDISHVGNTDSVCSNIKYPTIINVLENLYRMVKLLLTN